MATFQSLPGFREFYPADCAARNELFARWRETTRRYGFAEYDAPVLEPLELYTEKSGEEIRSQLFEFTDKGGRHVALRPEMTPSLARLVAAQAGSLRRPVKWCSAGEMYRYEKPQKGRLRAFYQFNADILGEPGPAADAECIALLIDALRGFGLKEGEFKVQICDRQIWFHGLEWWGAKHNEVLPILGVIDKWSRERPEVTKLTLKNILLDDTRVNDFYDKIQNAIQIKSTEGLTKTWMFNDQAHPLAERFIKWRELEARLIEMGFAHFFSYDHSIVRGLAYYTGFVFEAYQTVGTARALAGGGRYDNLLKNLCGVDLPAVGFAIGDVTVADLLRELGRGRNPAKPVDVYVAIVDEDQAGEVRPAAMRLVARLRQAGLRVDYPLGQRKEDKQFKAAKESARLWIAVAPAQAGGPFRVKNLETKGEASLPDDADFTTNLRNLLAAPAAAGDSVKAL